ncbi:dephospho-CoA kinase [Cutibacterium sp. WCA-380-WT-3A]|uniref:Dephospho-CoA kinase n=2 Tax=Cutibacterium porci TaxID=2605781 RepID=A0A7K0J767_9ACTN|nr:dephospho-CoA kinase [Cutibacterium porci]MSS45804.1 dephospho-CoA kinase [Cutibacterium porci]
MPERAIRGVEPDGVVRVGLTGGIASGKSTVSRLLAAHGATIIDYDQLSRDVVATGTQGLAQVVEAFGPQILAADGSLNRAALGSIVFSDSRARHRLESIIHPLVEEAARRVDDQARIAKGVMVVVHDIPLLVETGRADEFDVVVVTDIDPAEQVRRVVERDGASQDDAWARIRAQASRKERLAAADIVIDTSGPLRDLPGKVNRAWSTIIESESSRFST